MAEESLARVKYLSFDIFGTVMDLSGSLAGPAGEFLVAHGSEMTGPAFYAEWRERQRIEQYQDNLLMLRHSGYLETCRRAFVYCSSGKLMPSIYPSSIFFHSWAQRGLSPL